MLEHEERRLKYFPRDFSPVNNSNPGVYRRGKYLIVTPNGTYLDTDALSDDIDGPGGCNCPEGDDDCHCHDQAHNDQGASGQDWTKYMDATVKGLQAAGTITTNLKSSDMKKEIKAICGKKPLIRIGKKAKAKYQAWLECSKNASAQLMAGGSKVAAAASEAGAEEDNTAMWWIIGGAAFVLILLVVIIIIAIRLSRKKKQAEKK